MASTPSFSFAKGNARKLFSLPFYALGKLASLFVPRASTLWVFGSGAGVAEGARALYDMVRHEQPDVRAVWLVGSARERDDAIARRLDWVNRNSWRGFWLTLRASTIVITHGFGDVNRFGVFGAFVVQLWHGIPLKKLHLDTEVTVATKRGFGALLKRMYRVGGSATSLFVVASELVGQRMQSAFGLDAGSIAPIGDPRDDQLLKADATQSRERMLKLLKLEDTDARLVLYAPTWRDGSVDPAVPTDTEWESLASWAETENAHLVVRAHPLGFGAYERGLGSRIHMLTAENCVDITDVLGAFDVLITDYSSIAFDYSLTGQPIVWFAPDLAQYQSGRGFYESYDTVTEGQFSKSWPEVQAAVSSVLPGADAAVAARARSVRLAERLFAHRDGKSSERVLHEILRRRGVEHAALPSQSTGAASTVYFESFYGRQVSCNPLALDTEIARVAPDVRRIWGVESVHTDVPEGAIRVVLGTPQAEHARQSADVVIVNDWLRKDFRPTKKQLVLQTWHGTMLKKLALDRPNVSLRTRLATLRESRKWDVLLSQNEHCTTHLRSSYGYHGPIWQVGYPRNDELRRLSQAEAKARLGIREDMRVMAYAPTWRDDSEVLVDALDVAAFANMLPKHWILLVRGHTRTHEFGKYPELKNRLIDVSMWPNVNDIIVAADLFVTDYSSLMFDASVANIPMAFYVPDLEHYRDRERGFTFDFERDAPGPLLREPEQLIATLDAVEAMKEEYSERYRRWQKRFNPHDDGAAAQRVTQRLIENGRLKTALLP